MDVVTKDYSKKIPRVISGGLELKVDRDGFLQEPEKWNESVAADLAEAEKIKVMSVNHWSLVNCIREHYLKFGKAPPIRMLLKKTGFDLMYVYELFPGGPAWAACKVAGLPNPTGCV